MPCSGKGICKTETRPSLSSAPEIISARKLPFPREGFTDFAGRRRGEWLEPLVVEIEAAGGNAFGRRLDARKEDGIVAFLAAADAHSALDICVFNIGANANFPILDTTERVFRKVWEMTCYSASLRAARPRV
jgi:NAD(P)-dependent dehydrogenase (short-subunit alcohol dehydrogenase family)